MPGYNNYSYNNYPMYQANGYQQYSQAAPQQYVNQANSYAAQQQPGGIIWVDGEVGAKAYQLPAGWPVGTPMALWDTNDPIIYLKSTNQMGMPNPIQRIRYIMEEAPHTTQMLSSQEPIYASPDMSDYVRRDELEQLKEEMRTIVNENKGAK